MKSLSLTRSRQCTVQVNMLNTTRYKLIYLHKQQVEQGMWHTFQSNTTPHSAIPLTFEPKHEVDVVLATSQYRHLEILGSRVIQDRLPTPVSTQTDPAVYARRLLQRRVHGTRITPGRHRQGQAITFSHLRAAEIDVDNTLQIAWTKWRETTGVMCDRNIPTKSKAKVYKDGYKFGHGVRRRMLGSYKVGGDDITHN